MSEHPLLQLSAYLDEALAPSERGQVAAHLDGCVRCRAQLAELRATSRLIGALPPLTSRRSLVPRLDRAPVWLRPVRLLGAIGSGLFVFLFLGSAVIHSGGSLGGGTTTAEQLAEKGQFGAAMNALASDAAARNAAAPAAVPSPSGHVRFDIAGASPTPAARAATAPAPGVTSAGAAGIPAPFAPPPRVFLALAALCAIVALVAHRRLRRS
ncbi:MAG: anti-sigma factor family protein [Candidatus Limnocylindria bacterium]